MKDENDKLLVYFKGGVANGKIAKNFLFCRFFKKSYYECMGDIIIPSKEKG
jgi:hypothetical protein